ncbi:hypothetical protein K502DRAFT_324360 [Neoconidiobolus thromboides FSU 785]|nr:hypothetical protein K502DRAFT_324360 [Neoconidiobolus thromboides FSU 785]
MDFNNYNNAPFQEPLMPLNNGENNQQTTNSTNSGQGIISNFGGAHLTDFTKRKNWPLRVLGELKDFLHVVSPSGRFLFCSPSCLEMVGFSPEELVGRQVTDFIHVDDIDTFIRDFNLAITQKVFRILYRFRKKDDKFIILEINGHPYFPENSTTARCFFLMARPYPSKAASTIDSFLELRMENDRLTKRLLELQRESQEQNNTNDNSLKTNSGNNNISEVINYATGSSESVPPNNGNNKQLPPTMNAPSIDATKKIKKTKRQRAEEETHVCTDCGTVDSPEWRKGPQGPKTLCNACGLRYAKKNKKILKEAEAVGDAERNNS